jgi:RNA polymerase sigma-32 factor
MKDKELEIMPPEEEDATPAEAEPAEEGEEVTPELILEEDGAWDPEADGPEGPDPAHLSPDGDHEPGHGPFLLPAPSPRGAVAARDPLHLYLREIARFPMLAPEEEFALARRVLEENDQEAAFRLVTSHLRLVVRIAMDFQRRWMQNALDLIQEGNVGLMKAVQKFDPHKGIKFSYYAAFWIKAYILKYIMDNWRMVKIGTTQTQRKLFYNLNKERQRLRTQGFDPTAADLSQSLNVSEHDIEEMDQRMAKNDLSLNITLSEDSDATRLDFLPSLGPGVEDILGEREVARLIERHIKTLEPQLTDKELVILHERLLSDSPATLREIGQRYQVTRERVRQIEARLLDKLKHHLQDQLKDFSRDWIKQEE